MSNRERAAHALANEYAPNAAETGTTRVCIECRQPVSGKRHGWTRCSVGFPTCYAVVCAGCMGTHQRKHGEGRL